MGPASGGIDNEITIQLMRRAAVVLIGNPCDGLPIEGRDQFDNSRARADFYVWLLLEPASAYTLDRRARQEGRIESKIAPRKRIVAGPFPNDVAADPKDDRARLLEIAPNAREQFLQRPLA